MAVKSLEVMDMLDEFGFAIIPFPDSLARRFRQHICDYLGCAFPADAVRLTELILGYSKELFAEKLAKPMRYYPDHVTTHGLDWVEKLASIFGNVRCGVNFVPPCLQECNDQLHDASIDCFWRCVRPGSSDVGSPHRDSHFWSLADGTSLEAPSPFAYDERWKIWVPLYGCNSSNSLEVVSKSHKMDVPLETMKGSKPSIEEAWVQNQEWTCPLSSFDGTECILFHDDLVHRGPPNESPFVRFSSELTILLRRNKSL